VAVSRNELRPENLGDACGKLREIEEHRFRQQVLRNRRAHLGDDAGLGAAGEVRFQFAIAADSFRIAKMREEAGGRSQKGSP
jgi:hypothetical protein